MLRLTLVVFYLHELAVLFAYSWWVGSMAMSRPALSCC